MTQNSSAGSVVHNFDSTLLARIKCDPVLLSDLIDKALQKASKGRLARATIVDMGNRAVNMSVKSQCTLDWGVSYSKYFVDPGPRDPAASMAFVTAVSVSNALAELPSASFLSALGDPDSQESRPSNSFNDGIFSSGE